MIQGLELLCYRDRLGPGVVQSREGSGEDLKHLPVPKQATMEILLTGAWSDDRTRGNDFFLFEVKFRLCV